MPSEQEWEAHARAVNTLAILAPKIKDHEMLEKKLSTAPPHLRPIIYEVVAPRLFFKARPLEWYETQMRIHAANLPVWNGNTGSVMEPPVVCDNATFRRANELLAASIAKRTLHLVCAKCLREQDFPAIDNEYQSATIKRARRAGWVYDYKADPVREICPECSVGG